MITFRSFRKYWLTKGTKTLRMIICNVIFVEKYVNETSIIRIVGDDVHHIARVMRMSAGDHIYCCVNGKTAVCSIDEITSEFINTAIVEWVGRQVNFLFS